MDTGSPFQRLAERLVANHEFSVLEGDFASLRIDEASNKENLYYFVDSTTGRLVKDFVLRDGPRVKTLMEVTLIKKGQRFSPRIRLWKRDKSRAAREATSERLPHSTDPLDYTVKASVSTSECAEEFWAVISFLLQLSAVDTDGQHADRQVARSSPRTTTPTTPNRGGLGDLRGAAPYG